MKNNCLNIDSNKPYHRLVKALSLMAFMILYCLSLFFYNVSQGVDNNNHTTSKSLNNNKNIMFMLRVTICKKIIYILKSIKYVTIKNMFINLTDILLLVGILFFMFNFGVFKYIYNFMQ